MMILKAREGFTVTRTDAGIVYSSDDDLTPTADILSKLSKYKHFPKVLGRNPHVLVVEDVGNGEEVTDSVKFIQECARLLCELRQEGIKHGDLTIRNIIVRNNTPIAIDFFESNKEPSKRPETDSYHLINAAIEISGDPSRVMRRWLAVLQDQGFNIEDRRVLDVGAGVNQDFIPWIESEGAIPTGIDILVEGTDAFDYDYTGSDMVLLFSIWPYLVQQRGEPEALQLLERIKSNSNRVYFESQLRGDGPGYAKDERYIVGPNAKKLVTVPVTGRDATRTVWRL